MTSVITNIESPSHLISCEININENPKVSRITLGGQISYLDKDFILVIKNLGLDPRAFIEYDPDKDTLSGSMDGSLIQKVSSALELFIQSLSEDCYFNIVSFAFLLARNMIANYGRTEIYQVLKWIFDNKRTNLPTAVFLIMDGNVWNVEEISRLIRNNVKKYEVKLRLFALRVNNNVSSNLIGTVACNNKGYVQFVTDMKRMDK
ncbi:14502_t:CDS:2 [Funneliformis mosseae]|uniref:14502_t:CDS:1 n=1 Tax=Funneliformis mosseae TaxID=27381 RepID=A0A9N8VMD6_FUNMO|nr:14502_t:CDS:2 [Funneliformis mosseae]